MREVSASADKNAAEEYPNELKKEQVVYFGKNTT